MIRDYEPSRDHNQLRACVAEVDHTLVGFVTVLANMLPGEPDEDRNALRLRLRPRGPVGLPFVADGRLRDSGLDDGLRVRAALLGEWLSNREDR